MKLRPYDPETDFPAVRSWITDPRTHALWCAGRFAWPLNGENFNETLRANRDRGGDVPFTAADEDGRAVGFFCYAPLPDTGDGLLKFVVVDPALRGRGLGKEMLRLALEYAFGTCGADAVHLRVFTENAGAVRCYEHAGFTETGTEPDAYTYREESWGRRSMVFRKPAPGK